MTSKNKVLQHQFIEDIGFVEQLDYLGLSFSYHFTKITATICVRNFLKQNE